MHDPVTEGKIYKSREVAKSTGICRCGGRFLFNHQPLGARKSQAAGESHRQVHNMVQKKRYRFIRRGGKLW